MMIQQDRLYRCTNRFQETISTGLIRLLRTIFSILDIMKLNKIWMYIPNIFYAGLHGLAWHTTMTCKTTSTQFFMVFVGHPWTYYIVIAVLGPSVAFLWTLPLADWMLGSGDCCTGDSLYPLSPESVARPRRQFNIGGCLCGSRM